MSTAVTPPGKEPIEGGLDDRDIDAKSIVKLIIGLFALTALSAAAMWPVTNYFGGFAGDKGPPTALPPQPRLLTNEPVNLEGFRAEEEAKLNGYAWVSKTKGRARIPIARAMDLVVKKGLPARADTGPTIQATLPTEGSLRGWGSTRP